MSERRFPIIVLADDEAQYSQLFFWPYIEAVYPNAQLISAATASEARELVEKHKPDIVLLDITIPENEFDASVPAGGEYVHSQKVADAAKRVRPDSKIILVSSYAQQYVDHYPPDSTIVHPHHYMEQLQPAMIAACNDIKGEGHNMQEVQAAVNTEPAPVEIIERPQRRASRIEQIRRSPWHTGSKEGCEDSWAISSRLDDRNEPRKR